MDFYYNADGSKIFLKESDDTLVIAYKNDIPPKDLQKLLRGDETLAKFIISKTLEKRRLLLYKRQSTAVVSMNQLMSRLSQNEDIHYVCPLFFLNQNPIIISDEFIAAFKAAVTKSEIDAFNAKHQVEIIKAFDFSSNTYLQRALKFQFDAPLETVRLYFQSGLVDYSEPNFFYLKELKFAFNPNDPLFAKQWHLPHIQAQEAWDITRGDPNVIIAIIDDGVDLDHEDFSSMNKIVAGTDIESGDNDPRPAHVDDNHGTAVAGVATADGNNNVGVTGIAPDCHLLPIRLYGTNNVANDANVISYAADNGAHVINNSWGPPDGGGAFPLPNIVRVAFDYATDHGRGGKGCVIFFAAGNGNEHISAAATHDGYASYERVIAVAACNDNGVRSQYSDFGAEVAICAPSNDTAPGHRAIYTTDRMGPHAGYNAHLAAPPSIDPDPAIPPHYTSDFGGTSSASPLVAGVAALMLSISPDLSWQQARYILEATAGKIDFANADAIGQYKANGHSDWYGYGRVNAFQAVKGARSSVPDKDFVENKQVTLKRISGNRFVSTNVLHAIDARQRRLDKSPDVYIRSGPDGFLRAELAATITEVDVYESQI